MAHYTIRKFRYGPKKPYKDKRYVSLPHGRWTDDEEMQCPRRPCISTDTWTSGHARNKEKREVWRYTCGGCGKYFIMNL